MTRILAAISPPARAAGAGHRSHGRRGASWRWRSANVLDGATSIYWWQGALEQAGEAVLILKTRTELVERLTARILELHSYECPCVVALPIAAGNPQYLDWIAAETRPA